MPRQLHAGFCSRIACLLAIAVLLLGGCGQKGDLYHPDQGQARAASQPAGN